MGHCCAPPGVEAAVALISIPHEAHKSGASNVAVIVLDGVPGPRLAAPTSGAEVRKIVLKLVELIVVCDPCTAMVALPKSLVMVTVAVLALPVFVVASVKARTSLVWFTPVQEMPQKLTVPVPEDLSNLSVLVPLLGLRRA